MGQVSEVGSVQEVVWVVVWEEGMGQVPEVGSVQEVVSVLAKAWVVAQEVGTGQAPAVVSVLEAEQVVVEAPGVEWEAGMGKAPMLTTVHEAEAATLLELGTEQAPAKVVAWALELELEPVVVEAAVAVGTRVEGTTTVGATSATTDQQLRLISIDGDLRQHPPECFWED
jgi:hypothetical protein